MKILLFVIWTFFFSLFVHGQERVLKVNLEEITPYDTLKCSAAFEYSSKINYLGEYQANTNSWLFHIPDTTLEQSKYIQFFANRTHTPDIKNIHLAFRICMARDTTFFGTAFPFAEKIDTLSLHAKFVSQDTTRNSTFYGVENTVIGHRFDLVDPSLELQRSIVNMNSLYVKYRKTPLNQFYDIFYQMISQATNSHSNMLLLYDKRNWFSLEELLSLRNLFTEEQKQSYYGGKLDEYIKILTDKFPDIQLTNCLTKQKETIVVNENKYTLLVFSASWCAPCHKLIPLLKELYQKKKEVMNIVYITLDEPERLSEWNQLLTKYEIPWRSLTVDGRINEIRDKYKVRAIPYSYLIYPKRKKAEKIEIRNEADKLKIENIALTE